MKRFLILALAFLLIFTAAGCNTSTPTTQTADGEEKSFTLKFSDQNAEETNTNIWAKKFAELVNQKTNGTITVEIYPNASLTAYDIEPLQSGICDFLQYVPSSASDLDPRLGAFDAPYIYENEAHRQATFKYDSEPMTKINDSLKDSNVILIGAFCSGYRQITSNFPIKTLNDINGAKIRVVPSDLYIALFDAFGAASTPMNFTEVSTALITNVIDGQENPISTIVQNSLYEIQDYMSLTNHMPTNHGLWMNYATFQKLSPSQQQACLDAAYEASVWMDQVVIENEEGYLQQCKDNGMTIIDESSGLDIEAFREAGMSMYDKFSDQWGDMTESIRSVPR